MHPCNVLFCFLLFSIFHHKKKIVRLKRKLKLWIFARKKIRKREKNTAHNVCFNCLLVLPCVHFLSSLYEHKKAHTIPFILPCMLNAVLWSGNRAIHVSTKSLQNIYGNNNNHTIATQKWKIKHKHTHRDTHKARM